jgi:hypothetical protein
VIFIVATVNVVVKNTGPVLEFEFRVASYASQTQMRRALCVDQGKHNKLRIKYYTLSISSYTLSKQKYTTVGA